LGIAKTGVRVVVVGRDRQRGEAARKRLVEESGNPLIDLVLGDVSSIAGVDALAEKLLQLERIDVLVNNAGYLGSERRESQDGLELHLAANVLAPWRLTHALLPALRTSDSPHVLNVTGGSPKPKAVDVENLQAEKGFKGIMTYMHSKSCLEALSVALSRKLDEEGIRVNVVFPGNASTVMSRSLSLKGMPGLLKLMRPLFLLMFAEDGGKSAAKASRSTVWAVTSDALRKRSGAYFDTNCKEKKMHPSAYDSKVHQGIISVIESVSAV
tara:strand:- start:2850 stop:3656 length:807 start_codon:yes stop_codon:yes gene_type:complete